MTWEKVDFERSFILLENPKSGRTERIRIGEHVRKILEGLPRNGRYVFPDKDGEQIKDMRYVVESIKEEAGIQRFSHVSWFAPCLPSIRASNSVGLYALQGLLTQKTQGMTERYAHLADEALVRAQETIGDIINQYRKAHPFRLVKRDKAVPVIILAHQENERV